MTQDERLKDLVKQAQQHFTFQESKARLDDQGRLCVDSMVHTKLKKISHIPIEFGTTGEFWVGYNKLTSLVNSPETVNGEFKADSNNLTNLIGGPRRVTSNYIIRDNPLTSLEGLPESVGNWIILDYKPNLGMLRLLMVKDCQKIAIRHFDQQTIGMLLDILDRYRGQGRTAIMPCAAELHKAGYGGNAKL